jgi:hypothetical protein
MSVPRKLILCVDFDGVIHQYTSPWTDAKTISDPPVEGAFEWLDRCTSWFHVNIYSSRSSDPEAILAMKEWFLHHGTILWTRTTAETFVGKLFFPSKKPAAFLTVDDRCIRFEGDFSEPWMDPKVLLDFKPWNKL